MPPPASEVAPPPGHGSRELLFEGEEEFRRCAVFRRRELGRGMRLPGPAVVEQDDTTTIVHPGQEAVVDRFANLIITPTRSAKETDDG